MWLAVEIRVDGVAGAVLVDIDDSGLPLTIKPFRFTGASDAIEWINWVADEGHRVDHLNADGLEDLACLWNHGGREEWAGRKRNKLAPCPTDQPAGGSGA